MRPYPSTYNSLFDLRAFFRVTLPEFDEFWMSLTNDERYYYRTAPLV